MPHLAAVIAPVRSAIRPAWQVPFQTVSGIFTAGRTLAGKPDENLTLFGAS